MKNNIYMIAGRGRRSPKNK